MISLRAAETDSDLAAVRTLCWAYRDQLAALSAIEWDLMETFYPAPKYRVLMDALATEHARPSGIILLASDGDTPVGCAMSHALDGDTCEMKRVFVTPAARGKGVARQLCTAVMAQARTDGFTRVLLDTSANLTAARALYTQLGFAERGPYQPVPDFALPHLVFFEARL
ncbi:N-acetyltransferase [Sulfitobacter sp. SK012]|uniref:GNAT family N-acetyltransferase n=1 Tax=Sulfitobacter sp. SK012 TaxID=1389005 RepID=UPI000E0AC6E8|nr:GNAT family N-acetyltransferase [Sulfitobacter sp. SK012]AXI46226.1 N-acetyltransferase [Sulfitobacter sp. SK012]